MKQLLTLVAVLSAFAGFAQKQVTFIVDMRGYTGANYSGVFVNGTWNNWCGTCNPLTDPENDSVWTTTLPLTADSVEYKFTLDGWTGQEMLTAGSACTKTTGTFTNRFSTPQRRYDPHGRVLASLRKLHGREVRHLAGQHGQRDGRHHRRLCCGRNRNGPTWRPQDGLDPGHHALHQNPAQAHRLVFGLHLLERKLPELGL